MKAEEIKDLIEFLNQQSFQRVAIKDGEFSIELEKGGAAAVSYQEKTPSPQEVAPAPQTEPPKMENEGKFVTAPMVGTFYAAPAPDQPVFVKVGDRVSKDSVVCIIEAMKVMNEVKAGVSGVVAEVLTDDAQPVEFGTKLFRVVES